MKDKIIIIFLLSSLIICCFILNNYFPDSYYVNTNTLLRVNDTDKSDILYVIKPFEKLHIENKGKEWSKININNHIGYIKNYNIVKDQVKFNRMYTKKDYPEDYYISLYSIQTTLETTTDGYLHIKIEDMNNFKIFMDKNLFTYSLNGLVVENKDNKILINIKESRENYIQSIQNYNIIKNVLNNTFLYYNDFEKVISINNELIKLETSYDLNYLFELCCHYYEIPYKDGKVNIDDNLYEVDINYNKANKNKKLLIPIF